MTKISNEELQLKIQRLEAKVFHNQDLNIEPQLRELTAREQAEQITDDKVDEHHLGEFTFEAAKSFIDSHNRNYDAGSVKSLYGEELERYVADLNLCKALARKYSNLKAPEDLRNG